MAEDNKKQYMSDEEFLRRLAIARAQQRQLQQQQQPARDPANLVDEMHDRAPTAATVVPYYSEELNNKNNKDTDNDKK